MLLAFVLVFLLYARLRFLYTIIGAMAPFPVTTALCIFTAVDLAFAGKTRADTRSRGWLAVFSTRGLGCGRRTFD